MAADRVFLDYDQAALDRAYEQVHWAPNMQELLERRGRDSEAVRARLGRPRTEAYGPSAIETLDIYATPSPNAPVFVFLHGGAWLRGTAAASAYPAEMFVKAGAHFVVPDFARSLRSASTAWWGRCSARWRGWRSTPRTSAAIPSRSTWPATPPARIWPATC